MKGTRWTDFSERNITTLELISSSPERKILFKVGTNCTEIRPVRVHGDTKTWFDIYDMGELQRTVNPIVVHNICYGEKDD